MEEAIALAVESTIPQALVHPHGNTTHEEHERSAARVLGFCKSPAALPYALIHNQAAPTSVTSCWMSGFDLRKTMSLVSPRRQIALGF